MYVMFKATRRGKCLLNKDDVDDEDRHSVVFYYYFLPTVSINL